MNSFVMMCVIAIKSGRMTVDQVPLIYRDEVVKLLDK